MRRGGHERQNPEDCSCFDVSRNVIAGRCLRARGLREGGPCRAGGSELSLGSLETERRTMAPRPSHGCSYWQPRRLDSRVLEKGCASLCRVFASAAIFLSY